MRRLLEEAHAGSDRALVPHERTTAYALLGTSLACAVGAGVAGALSISCRSHESCLAVSTWLTAQSGTDFYGLVAAPQSL